MSFAHRFARAIQKIYWKSFRPHTHGVKALILDKSERVLLVQMSYQDGWALPGGGVKKNETSIQALGREIREELGLNITDANILATFQNEAEGKIDSIDLIECRSSGEIQLNSEITEADWFKLDMLPELTPATARRLDEWKMKKFSRAW
jgi:ADP-ribose pyrophosphatase YjhB (NUDIX family)